MDTSARLSLIRQRFTELLSICEPGLVSELQPTVNQQERYKDLLKSVKNHIDAIETDLKTGVLDEGTVQKDLPKDLLLFYKEKILPRLADLNSAFEKLDPSLFELFQLLDGVLVPRGDKGKIKFTFDVAIERMEQLVEDNPNLEDSFRVSRAFEVLDSKLIDFAPDKWLDNAGHLYPIRTSRKGAEIPVQAKFRMIELYRSYVFGNWLSVLALARSILEYVILDTLHKFGISETYKVTYPVEKEKSKRLSQLIEEIADHLPKVKADMESIRDYGNEYIHPKQTSSSKASLFQREQVAQECLLRLRNVVEELYLAEKIEA